MPWNIVLAGAVAVVALRILKGLRRDYAVEDRRLLVAGFFTALVVAGLLWWSPIGGHTQVKQPSIGAGYPGLIPVKAIFPHLRAGSPVPTVMSAPKAGPPTSEVVPVAHVFTETGLRSAKLHNRMVRFPPWHRQKQLERRARARARTVQRLKEQIKKNVEATNLTRKKRSMPLLHFSQKVLSSADIRLLQKERNRWRRNRKRAENYLKRYEERQARQRAERARREAARQAPPPAVYNPPPVVVAPTVPSTPPSTGGTQGPSSGCARAGAVCPDPAPPKKERKPDPWPIGG
jgi:hypothetical protein